MSANAIYVAADGEETFMYDAQLPSLPVADLDTTLDKYLQSTRPHLTDEQYATTSAIVERFKHGAGKQLQALLIAKSKRERNWVKNDAILDCVIAIS